MNQGMHLGKGKGGGRGNEKGKGRGEQKGKPWGGDRSVSGDTRSEVLTGKVRAWNNNKNSGFILGDDDGCSYYFNLSNLSDYQRSEDLSHFKGTSVRFVPCREHPKGPAAADVRRRVIQQRIRRWHPRSEPSYPPARTGSPQPDDLVRQQELQQLQHQHHQQVLQQLPPPPPQQQQQPDQQEELQQLREQIQQLRELQQQQQQPQQQPDRELLQQLLEKIQQLEQQQQQQQQQQPDRELLQQLLPPPPPPQQQQQPDRELLQQLLEQQQRDRELLQQLLEQQQRDREQIQQLVQQQQRDAILRQLIDLMNDPVQVLRDVKSSGHTCPSEQKLKIAEAYGLQANSIFNDGKCSICRRQGNCTFAHIIPTTAETTEGFATGWAKLNADKYKEAYNVRSCRNFILLCGTEGQKFEPDKWSCHHLFDHYMFVLLPGLDKSKFDVLSLHPFAQHLPRFCEFELPRNCMPYRRGLAARAKIAMKHCSPFLTNQTDEERSALLGRIDFSESSSQKECVNPSGGGASSSSTLSPSDTLGLLN